MRIAIIGSGHVGLVTGACLSNQGHQVVCVDKAEPALISLQKDQTESIPEPGLRQLIDRSSRAGRLFFSNSIEEAVAASDIIFLAVETYVRDNGIVDMSDFDIAVREVGLAVRKSTILITKSTVPVGTSDRIEEALRADFPKKEICVVSNPTFLHPGSAVADFSSPDRIVIGTEDPQVMSIMRQLYQPFFSPGETPFFCDRRSCELIKYATDAFLSIKVGFFNEIADLCEKADADVRHVATGIGMFTGVDGMSSKLAPDRKNSYPSSESIALVRIGRDFQSPVSLVEASIAVNNRRKFQMARKVMEACGGDVKNKKIGVFGLRVNREADVLGDTSSLAIVQILIDHGAVVHAYASPPIAKTIPLVDGIIFCDEPYEVAAAADAIVLMTCGEQLSSLDLFRLKETVAKPIFIDLCNIRDYQKINQAGFFYVGIGVKSKNASEVFTDSLVDSTKELRLLSGHH